MALLERGGRVPFTDCLGEYSGCAILCRASGLRRVPSTSDTLCSPCLCYMGEYAGDALGGQSAVNFGVWAAPSTEDLRKAYPPKMRTEKLVQGFLKDVDQYIANDDAFKPVPWQRKVAAALTSRGNALINQRMQRDDTKSDTKLQNTHAGYLTNVRALRNDLGERQNSWDALVDSLPDSRRNSVTTITGYEVTALRQDGEYWVAVPKRDSRVTAVRAKKVFIACGALETPALLLRSFKIELSPMVGKGIMNHEQSSTVIPVSATEPGVSNGMHPIATINANSSGDSSNETMMSSLTNSIMARLSNALTPRAVVKATCCFLLPPHGLAWSCCYNDARMQVFRDTNGNGQVRIDGDGNPRLYAPTVSNAAAATAEAHYWDVLSRFRVGGILSSSVIRTPYKSSWHYVGSMKVPEFNNGITSDAAVDHNTHVLGSNSKPLRGGAGIYVADASLARHVPVVNTMSIAAYSGYVSAVLALESGERESK